MQIALNSFKKAVLFKHMTEQVSRKIVKRVKYETLKMWQKARLERALITSMLKTKEYSLQYKVLKALAAN